MSGVALTSKSASSQVAWALLTEGVTQARIEAHRLEHLLNRARKLVDTSEEKEHLYQVAGDIIEAVPQRFEQLVIALDRTSLALSKMGEEFLSSRLSLSDRTMVDEAIEAAFGRSIPKHSMKARVADKYLKAHQGSK